MSKISKGQIIAGYELGELLGKGGMGTVYRARQISMDREIALKILKPELAKKDPKFCEQFVEEARAAGKLHHQNIIGVHDVGVSKINNEKVYYFSMEIVVGRDCKEILYKEGPLDTKMLNSILVGISSALEYAESMNMVHRDIKPENIMITNHGEVKLADLGLAMQTDEENDGSVKKGSDGKKRVMGTPRYMSPEQAKGDAVGSQSDQYCFGTTLFHLITGKPPFNGENNKDLMRAQVISPIPDIREFGNYSEALSVLCKRLMQKKPKDRFRDARELSDAINLVIENKVPKSEIIKATFKRREQKKSSSGAIVAIIFIIIAVGVFFAMSKGNKTTTLNINKPNTNENTTNIKDSNDVIKDFKNNLPSDLNLAAEALKKEITKYKKGTTYHSAFSYELRMVNEKIKKANMATAKKELDRQVAIIKDSIEKQQFKTARKLIYKLPKLERGSISQLLYNGITIAVDKSLNDIKTAKTINDIELIEEKLYDIVPATSNSKRIEVFKTETEKKKKEINASIAKTKASEETKAYSDFISITKKIKGQKKHNSVIKDLLTIQNKLTQEKSLFLVKRTVSFIKQIKETHKLLSSYIQTERPKFPVYLNNEKKRTEIRIKKVYQEFECYVVTSRKEVSIPFNTKELPVCDFIENALRNTTWNEKKRDNALNDFCWYYRIPTDTKLNSPMQTFLAQFSKKKKVDIEDSPVLQALKATDFAYNSNKSKLHENGKKLYWRAETVVDITKRLEKNIPTLFYKQDILPTNKITTTVFLQKKSIILIGIENNNHKIRIAFNSHPENNKLLIAFITDGDKAEHVKPTKKIDNKYGNKVKLGISFENSLVNFSINDKTWFSMIGDKNKDSYKLSDKNKPIKLIYQAMPQKNLISSVVIKEFSVE